MEIYISRDGQRFGPFPLSQVQDYLKSGRLLLADMAWYEGATDWVPLSAVPGVSGSDGPLPIPQDMSVASGNATVAYHHVSKLRFAIFSVVSFGIYHIYWFYKNWEFVKQRDRSRIHPFWRGIFSPIWCYQLCKDIARNCGGLSSGTLILVPLLYFLLLMATRLPDPYWLVSLASFAPLLELVNRIDEVNQSRGVVASYYRKPTGWSVFLSAGGTLLMALLLIEQFGLIPATKVVTGTEMRSSEIKYLRSANIIENREIVLLFYSTGLISIRDEGNVLTDRRVISYELDSDSSKLVVAAAVFADIQNIEVEYGKSAFDDTVVTVTKGEDEDFILLLSTEDRGDRRFVERLMELWKSASKYKDNGEKKPAATD